MYNITFNCVDGTKTLDFNGTTSVKDMISEYKKSLTGKKNFMFIVDGQLIEENSNKPLKTLLKNDSVVLVIDKDEWGIEEQKTSIETVNKNQFKERNLKGKKSDPKEILVDMAIYGCIAKKLIDSYISIGSNSFMSADEAIQKGEKDPFFVLGIFAKYLNNLGIKAVIDKHYGNVNERKNNLSSTILQFIFNGLIFKKKFYFYFALDEPTIKKLYESKEQQDFFRENLKNGISSEYGIKEEDIIITNPVHDKYYLLIVLLKDEKINLKKEMLMDQFKCIPNLCNLIKIQKENIIERLILSKSMLDPNGDNLNGEWEYYAQRGGEDYLPPEGWLRYGLNVYNKYDNRNNDWLMCDGRKGEWCIAYSWLSYEKNSSNFNNMYENKNDIKNKGKKVGKGIYCSQTPEFMEELTESVNIKGKEYKLGLMLRVNPRKIRCPENKDDLWVVDGNCDEIRPYGILLKK